LTAISFSSAIITENVRGGNLGKSFSRRYEPERTGIIRAVNIYEFDFVLPSELIAQFPAEQRTSIRMLHLEGSTGALHDAAFVDLAGYVRAGEVMVFNNTRD